MWVAGAGVSVVRHKRGFPLQLHMNQSYRHGAKYWLSRCQASFIPTLTTAPRASKSIHRLRCMFLVKPAQDLEQVRRPSYDSLPQIGGKGGGMWSRKDAERGQQHTSSKEGPCSLDD